jgi:hypothetical protein
MPTRDVDIRIAKVSKRKLQLLLLDFLTAGKSWSFRLQPSDLSMKQAKESDNNQMYGDYEIQ